MSLINEALRKARQAASEHESKPPQGAFRPAKAYPSRRSGRPGGPLTVALIAVAAAAIGAAAAWWLLGGRQPTATEASADLLPVLVTGTPTAPTAAISTVEAERSGPAGTDPTPVRVPTVVETHVVSTSAHSVDVTAADDPGPAPAGAVSNPPVRGPEGERVFVIDADLGYTSLSLGFIVARAGSPFAEINGVQVSVGSEIEGFTVEAIEADRVVLRDAKGPLVLRVP